MTITINKIQENKIKNHLQPNHTTTKIKKGSSNQKPQLQPKNKQITPPHIKTKYKHSKEIIPHHKWKQNMSRRKTWTYHFLSAGVFLKIPSNYVCIGKQHFIDGLKIENTDISYIIITILSSQGIT